MKSMIERMNKAIEQVDGMIKMLQSMDRKTDNTPAQKRAKFKVLEGGKRRGCLP